MAPEIIALMLTLQCSGHTNATCRPEIREFPTIEACEKELEPVYDTYGGQVRGRIDGVCFKSVK